MAIVKCEKGHYYDDRRFGECPYCEKLQAAADQDDAVGEHKTQYRFVPVDEEGSVTQYYGDDVDEGEKTIGIYRFAEDNLLTAGWLVCVAGPDKGRSFSIYPGRSFAGRSENMDIVFYGDRGISRDRHFSIIYDPKSVRFFAVEGNAATYVNGTLLSVHRELFENDRIRAGESEFCFIPFCKGERCW